MQCRRKILRGFAEKEVIRPLFLTCGGESGADKDDLWNPYVWREMSAEAMCYIFLKEQGCVIYDSFGQD